MTEKHENPFSELNAALFPTQAQQAANKRARNDARAKSNAAQKPTASPKRPLPHAAKLKKGQESAPQNEFALFDEDKELFFAALGQVKTLPPRTAAPVGESMADALKKLPVPSGKNSTKPVPAAMSASANTAVAQQPGKIAAVNTGPEKELAQKELAEDSPEALLFEELKDVTPLQGKARIPAPPTAVPPPALDESNPLQDLIDGKIDFTMSGSDECLEGHVLGLDLLTVAKLQQRYYSPEAHIDLHGLNSQQAFHNIIGFFRNAYLGGKRTVLVVTGRGLNSPEGNPILREKVQEWFTQEPLRRIILAFCAAKQEDGGTGALYVLLRKYKKKQGKVQWDRLPTDPELYRLLL